MISNGKKMPVKPARLYGQGDLSFDQIKVGNVIPVTVTGYDWEKREVQCNILPEMKAFISERNFDFPEIIVNFVDKDCIPKAIKSHINKQIIAKVIKKHDDGVIELDRRAVVKDTVEYLSSSIGDTVLATIEHIYDYGLFIDLGNGVQSLLHISEISKCRCSNLNKLFRIGEEVEVKLLSFDRDTSKFKVSRIKAYERKWLKPGSIQQVKVFSNVKGGAFVEFDPATTGIMNVPVELKLHVKCGEYVMCWIKSNKGKGFRANFLAEVKKPQ